LQSNELVFVNFYADWCRFSQMLTPVYEEAARKVEAEFTEPGSAVMAKVDCDREGGIAARYQVSKYPTLKLFRFGQPIKKEYRGQRSPDALAEFVRSQLKNPITSVSSLDQLDSMDSKKRNIIGYFDSEDAGDYRAVFKKVASNLRDDCAFYSASGPISESERVAGNKIVYRAPGAEHHSDMIYSGSTDDYNMLVHWVTDKCVPLVREITFENAEELTEEGLPFMILFHNPTDTITPEKYKKQVAVELLEEKSSVNFLTADGLKFTHPLHHLGKSANDLPVLAIDSFRHMYVWSHDVRADIDKPGLLKEFIEDLKSGKLHREFHQGPDPTQPPALPEGAHDVGHIPKDAEGDQQDDAQTKHDGQGSDTTPPESLFKKLGPSRNRYTLLRDEL